MTTTYELATIPVEDVQDDTATREARPFDSAKHMDVCFLCGRGMTAKGVERAAWVHLAGAGCVLVAIDLGDVDGDMGWFPVGPECAKRVPRNFRQ